MAIEDLLGADQRQFSLLQGVVTTTAQAPNPPNYPFSYCGVQVGGAAGETLGLRFMDNYYPVIGDTVYLAWFGTDGFILGKLVNNLSTPGITSRVFRVSDWNTVSGAVAFTWDTVEIDQAATITVGSVGGGGITPVDAILHPTTVQCSTIVGNPTTTATATGAPNPNLLSAAAAGAESSAAWATAAALQTAPAQSTDFARTGTHSIKLISDGTAINSGGVTPRATGVVAGSGYDLQGYARVTQAARNVFMFVQWYNSSNGVVGSQSFTSNIIGDTSGFTSSPFRANIIAPATADRVDVFFYFGTQNGSNLPNGEAAYFDDLSITLTGGGTTGSGTGGGVNSLNRVVQSMEGGPHESTLEELPASISWAGGPELVTPLPGANTALTYFGYIYLDGSRISTASNTRVALRFAESYVKLISSGIWVQKQSDVIPTGQRYTEDLINNTDWSGYSRIEPDGSVSFNMNSGFAIQFYGLTRASITPADVSAAFATIQARLIPDNLNQTDDRVNANVLLGVGLDWWDTPTGSSRQEMAIGRFQFVPRDGTWAAFNVWSGPSDLAVETNPDGSGGFQTPWSQGLINWKTTGALSHATFTGTPPPLNAMSGGVSGGNIAHPVTISCATTFGKPNIIATSGGGQSGGVAKLISDMVDPNVNFPDGDAKGWSFGPGPELDQQYPDAGWTGATFWGVVYQDHDIPTTATNTRIQFADWALWCWRNSQNQWVQYQSMASGYGGYHGFTIKNGQGFSNQSIAARLRAESLGYSDKMDDGYWTHIWANQASIPANDIGGAAAWFRCRLILDNGAGTDDRAQCNVVASCGSDWYKFAGAQWAPGTPDGPHQIYWGRMTKIPHDGSWLWVSGNSWAGTTAWGGDPSGARLVAHPPPFPG